MKQQHLIRPRDLPSKAFGGSLLKNSHAKGQRPFSPRAAIHLVMRARRPYSLMKRGRASQTAKTIAVHAKRNHVHIHRYANAGNHLHMLIECREKRNFQNFMRAVSGAIALSIKRSERNSKPRTPNSAENLWLQRPWTRIVARHGREFVLAWRYVDLNEIEAGSWGVTRSEARAIQYGDLGPPRPWLRFG